MGERSWLEIGKLCSYLLIPTGLLYLYTNPPKYNNSLRQTYVADKENATNQADCETTIEDLNT